MKGRLTQIRAADGQHVVTDLQRAPTLLELQTAVGGPIEVVPNFVMFEGRPCVAFRHRDKDGKTTFNVEATILWGKGSTLKMSDDVLMGDVVIVTGDAAFLGTL